MAPCGVIFHENVNFLFVAQKCQVIHAFHKTHKQNVIALIETHILGDFINKMVFGDQRVSTENKDGEQHSVHYFGKFIHITGKPYTHRYIGHVLLNKMIASWTLSLKNKESCALFSVPKGHEIEILDVLLPLLAQCTYYGLYMEFLKIMFFQSYFSFSQWLWVTSSWNLAWMCKWFNSN